MRKGQCRACGTEDLELLYVVEGSVKYPKQRRWYPERLTICQGCHDRGPTPVDEWYVNRVRWTRIVGRGEPMPPTPCEHCGVAFVRNADPLLRRMTCSAACLTSLTRSRNGNKGSGQPCETCGEQIITGRADSRHCGSACRQKAYRQRQAGAAAPKAEAPPLTDSRGRRLPQRSQRESLQKSIPFLSGLTEAMGQIRDLDESLPRGEAARMGEQLDESIAIIETLHGKLQARTEQHPHA